MQCYPWKFVVGLFRAIFLAVFGPALLVAVVVAAGPPIDGEHRRCPCERTCACAGVCAHPPPARTQDEPSSSRQCRTIQPGTFRCKLGLAFVVVATLVVGRCYFGVVFGSDFDDSGGDVVVAAAEFDGA